MDAEHFKKISCLVDFIMQAKEAHALFVAQEMSGMLAWGLVPSMFWFGEEEFGHPPGLAAELETGRCQQAGSADSAPDGKVTGDIVPCRGCEGAQAALDGSGDGQPGDKDEGGEELSACDASIGAGHARAASEGFGLGSGDVATRDRTQRPRKVIKHRDRTQKPGRKRVGDRTRKPRRVQQDPLKDQEPVCVAKGYKGSWGSVCFPQGVVQCKVPRDLSKCPGLSGEMTEDEWQLQLPFESSCTLQQSFVLGCSVPAEGHSHSLQVGKRYAPVLAVSGPLLGEPAGPDAGSSCQTGQVEVSGAHKPFQYQAQVAQSGLDSSCVPPSGSPGADRCPGRSGDSAEDKAVAAVFGARGRFLCCSRSGAQVRESARSIPCRKFLPARSGRGLRCTQAASASGSGCPVRFGFQLRAAVQEPRCR